MRSSISGQDFPGLDVDGPALSVSRRNVFQIEILARAVPSRSGTGKALLRFSISVRGDSIPSPRDPHTYVSSFFPIVVYGGAGRCEEAVAGVQENELP